MSDWIIFVWLVGFFFTEGALLADDDVQGFPWLILLVCSIAFWPILLGCYWRQK